MILSECLHVDFGCTDDTLIYILCIFHILCMIYIMKQDIPEWEKRLAENKIMRESIENMMILIE